MKNNQLIIYQTEDGKVKIETHFEKDNSIRKIGISDFSNKSYFYQLTDIKL